MCLAALAAAPARPPLTFFCDFSHTYRLQPAARSTAAPYAESPEHGGSNGSGCGDTHTSSANGAKAINDRPEGGATTNGAEVANGAGAGCCAGAGDSATESGPATPAATAAAATENGDVLKGMEGMSAGALVASFRRAQEERVALYRKFNG